MLVAIAFLLGGVIGGIEVAAPAFAISHQVPAAGGLLIAVAVGRRDRRARLCTAVANGGRPRPHGCWSLLGTLTAAVLLAASARRGRGRRAAAGGRRVPESGADDDHAAGGPAHTGTHGRGGVRLAVDRFRGRRRRGERDRRRSGRPPRGARPAFLVAAVAGGLATGFAALARRRFLPAPAPATMVEIILIPPMQRARPRRDQQSRWPGWLSRRSEQDDLAHLSRETRLCEIVPRMEGKSAHSVASGQSERCFLLLTPVDDRGEAADHSPTPRTLMTLVHLNLEHRLVGPLAAAGQRQRVEACDAGANPERDVR